MACGMQQRRPDTWEALPGLPLALRSDPQSSKFLDPEGNPWPLAAMGVQSTQQAPAPQLIRQPGYRMRALSSLHSRACDSFGESTGLYRLTLPLKLPDIYRCNDQLRPLEPVEATRHLYLGNVLFQRTQVQNSQHPQGSSQL